MGESNRDALRRELVDGLRGHLAWLGLTRLSGVPAPAAGRLTAPQADPPQPSEHHAKPVDEVRRQDPVADGAPRASGDPAARLQQVRTNLGECTRCKLHRGRDSIVFGQGSAEAELVFVGEGPGAEEDKQGLAFVGAAGELLTKMIEAMGYTREKVYICNIVKCRPPGNRDPETDEVEACEPFLKDQLDAIRPRVIVTLGKVAVQTLLRSTTPVSRLRGHWTEYQGIDLMPTFHPAYLLRNASAKRQVWDDLKSVMERLGRTLPVPGRHPR